MKDAVIDRDVTEQTDNEFLESIRYENAIRSTDKMSIGYLSRPCYCFSPDEKTEKIYEIMKHNPAITEFVIVRDDTAAGFMTRTAFNEILGGQYGFTLHSGKPIHSIMKTDFLKVNFNMPIDEVSDLAMKRPFERLYNPIVIEQEGKYRGIVTVKDLLDTCMNIARSERDEIAIMKDSLKIGLFFMDRNFIIQDHYSRYLEEILSEKDVSGRSFISLLSESFSAIELGNIRDYFEMVFKKSFPQETLDDINPLGEFCFINGETREKKVFNCNFSVIEESSEKTFILAAVYDVTARVELQQRLAEEENRRQEEMKKVFELLQVEPRVFNDFLEDAEYEFERINKTLKNDDMSPHEALVEVYQSVHAVKANAVILKLDTFSDKAHKLETKIKKLRGLDEVPFVEMLNLAIDLEKLFLEKDGFKTTVEKINSYKTEANHNKGQNVLVELLANTIEKTSRDLGKKVKFIIDDIDDVALEKGPRRIIKESLIQLSRNAVAHGIEKPEERGEKNETGFIRLSIKLTDGNVHVKLADDGRGLDYEKIAERAKQQNLIKPLDADDKNALLKLIFTPGFSTAETEGMHAGRGIGLSLVQERVRGAKGSIKVQSEPGKGTVFNIYFPVG